MSPVMRGTSPSIGGCAHRFPQWRRGLRARRCYTGAYRFARKGREAVDEISAAAFEITDSPDSPFTRVSPLRSPAG